MPITLFQIAVLNHSVASILPPVFDFPAIVPFPFLLWAVRVYGQTLIKNKNSRLLISYCGSMCFNAYKEASVIQFITQDDLYSFTAFIGTASDRENKAFHS